jgi:lipopolysaccharide/colanic/teichoic acid biosynthesis glycosyltransferase
MSTLYRSFWKQVFDRVLSLLIVVMFAPFLLMIAILVRVWLGSPVLFRQQRPGYKGKLFTIYKFRTMTNERDEKGQLLPDGQRLKSFGRWLRSTSMDELPEFFNIIKGDMSLIGPRPLLLQSMDRYSAEQMRRHDVKPGITGWAQVNGRNTIKWEERFKLDVWYVDHVSFRLDIKIIFLTCIRVFRRQDINHPGFVAEHDRVREGGPTR